MISCLKCSLKEAADFLGAAQISEEDIAYSAAEEDEISGIVVFCYSEDTVFLKHLAGDPAVFELLIRTALFVAERHGCTKFLISGEAETKLGEIPFQKPYPPGIKYEICAFFEENKGCT